MAPRAPLLKVDKMRDWLVDALKDLSLIAMVLTLVAVPVALLLTHVNTQYKIAQAGYDIARVTREHRALTEDLKKLQIEAAVQGRTERMTTLARERYGLAPTRPEQITIVERPSAVDAPARHASLSADVIAAH